MIVKNLKYLFILVISFNLYADDSKNSSAHLLNNLSGKLIEIQLEKSKEKNLTEKENSHLNTAISITQENLNLYKIKNKNLKLKIETIKKRILKEKEKNIKLYTISKIIIKSIDQILSTLEKQTLALPPPLKRKLKNKLPFNKPSTLNNKILYFAKLSELLSKTYNSIHLVKEELNPPNAITTEVDVLYIGTSIAYYISPNKKLAGILLNENQQWKIYPCNNLNKNINKALLVYKKELSPILVSLPVKFADK